MPKKPSGLTVSPSPLSKNGELKSPLSPTQSQGKSHTATKPEGVAIMTADHSTRGLEPIHGPLGHLHGSLDHPHGSLDHSLASVQSSENLNQSARNLMPPPPSPAHVATTKGGQASGKSFFSSYNRTKSANRLRPEDITVRQVSRAEALSSQQPQGVFTLPGGAESSLNVTLSGYQTSEVGQVQDTHGQDSHVAPPDQLVPASGPQNLGNGTGPARKLKSKPRLAHFLGRRGSIRAEPGEVTPQSSSQDLLAGSGDQPLQMNDPGPTTAPLQHEGDRSFREMMSSTLRNRSADRQRPAGSENSSIASKERGKHGTFFHNLKSSGTKAADGIGKAGKGIFGRFTRGVSVEKVPTVVDEHYVCNVITLPLVEQTRLTRISKRLEQSRDKTEFWMPALPWRCIDYLNYKGFDAEGLYRIPGGGTQIKHWQKRFDLELDINLFEEPDLYDIHIIGSMFKAWLRDIPDELLPKETQARIGKECAGATEVPQMLKDELSKLPPYNYYLLFAITCHLSLLHSYVDQNKMSFGNLCICFQPCLKIDGFCFQFLVCHWKHCWQGCWTEKEALAEEYQIMDGPPSSSAGASTTGSKEVMDERAISTSDSSKAPSLKPVPGKAVQTKRPSSAKGTPEKKIISNPIPISITNTTPSKSLPITNTPATPVRPVAPLSPMSPLSPLRM
ncbi:MAG: hypothetical protein M1816_001964 [Peltula sp. TS41687]|nr:MAG: hypothetical protein M1816_001964 [Peltula sp. TS41687]